MRRGSRQNRNHPVRRNVQRETDAAPKNAAADQQQRQIGASGQEIKKSAAEPSDGPSKPVVKIEKTSSDFVIARWTKVLGLCTLGLFIVTFGSVVVLLLTEFTLRDTLVETRKAADAAKDAVGVAQSTMQLDQRAWIGIDYIRPVPIIPEVGKTFGAEGSKTSVI